VGAYPTSPGGRSDAHRGYTTKGATAFSARTIVEFLEAVAEEARD